MQICNKVGCLLIEGSAVGGTCPISSPCSILRLCPAWTTAVQSVSIQKSQTIPEAARGSAQISDMPWAGRVGILLRNLTSSNRMGIVQINGLTRVVLW